MINFFINYKKMNKNEYGFYCSKCKQIPLIQINPKDEDINILSTCNCGKQYLPRETFFKNYYKQIILSKDEEEDKNFNFNNEEVNDLIQKYLKYKEEFNSYFKKMKETIIDILNEAIKVTELLYNINKNINDKIDNIIQILIKNYRLNPKINNNIKNIILNSKISDINSFPGFDEITGNFSFLKHRANQIFKYKYIIENNSLKFLTTLHEDENNHIFLDEDNHIFLEIEKDIFAKAYKGSYCVKIFNYNNYNEAISLNFKNTIKNILIDENKKYLISLDQQSIKFWDIQNIMNNMKENDKKAINYNPVFQCESPEIISTLYYLEKNLLLLINNKNIYIYQYNINERDLKKIKSITTEEVKLTNIFFSDNSVNYCKIIKRGKNKINICFLWPNGFILIDFPELKIIDIICIDEENDNLPYYCAQINNDEIIIGKGNCLKIYDLKYNKISLTKEIGFEMLCLKILKDNTLLVGGLNGIQLFLLKALQEVTGLIKLENFQDQDSVVNPIFPIMNRLISVYELSNGNIMLVLHGSIKIFALNNK